MLLSRYQKIFSVFRLKPFDTSTVEGRAQERLRRAGLTALVSLAAQGVGILAFLISVPLALNYLGAERYGIWLAISSLMAVLGFMDLGIGNGLLNKLTEAIGKDDDQSIKIYISSAFYLVLTLVFLFGFIWLIVAPHISWSWLFNTSTQQTSSEIGPALSVFVWCVLIGLPLGLVQKIYIGYQEGYFNGGIRALGSVLGLGGVLLAINYHASLAWFVLSLAGAPVFSSLLGCIWLFGRKRPYLRPRTNLFRKDAFLTLFQSGALFFVLQLAAAVGFQADSLVVSFFLGAEQVPQYAVPTRLFLYVPSLINFFLAPLWPAYGEAISRGDISWVLKTFRRSMYVSVSISTFFSLILVFFGRSLITLWVGPGIKLSFDFLVGLGLWVVMLGVAGPLSMLLNGANVIGFQAVLSVFMVIGNIVLSIFLVQSIGVAGPIYGSVISWVLFSLAPTVFFMPYFIGSWKNKSVVK